MTHLPRRMRKQRSSTNAYWHITVTTPGLTQENADLIRKQWRAAQRTGVVVTNDQIKVQRIR